MDVGIAISGYAFTTPDLVDRYDQMLPGADYVRREAMVPMRDGVKLFTVVMMKRGTSKAPILLSRTLLGIVAV